MKYRVVRQDKKTDIIILYSYDIEDINLAFWSCMFLSNDFYHNYVEEDTNNGNEG